jgi:hypothetical protein
MLVDMDKKSTYTFRITFAKINVTKHNEKCIWKDYTRSEAILHELKGNYTSDY